jgi:hypothetical protein
MDSFMLQPLYCQNGEILIVLEAKCAQWTFMRSKTVVFSENKSLSSTCGQSRFLLTYFQLIHFSIIGLFPWRPKNCTYFLWSSSLSKFFRVYFRFPELEFTLLTCFQTP